MPNWAGVIHGPFGGTHRVNCLKENLRAALMGSGWKGSWFQLGHRANPLSDREKSWRIVRVVFLRAARYNYFQPHFWKTA